MKTKSLCNMFLFVIAIYLNLSLSGCQSDNKLKISDNSSNTTYIQENAESSIDGCNSIPEGRYSGWLCGFVQDQQKCDLLAISLEDGTIEVIKQFTEKYIGSYGAMNRDGNRIAYTKFISENGIDGTKLIIEDLDSNENKEFFTEPKGQIITSVQWHPDNERVLITMNNPDELYYSTSLTLIDTIKGDISILDKGNFVYGNAEVDKNSKSVLSQDDLDRIIKSYGNTPTIPIEENGKWNYFEIRNPSISPDGKQVLYTISFYRNVTPAFHETDEIIPKLWLASGLWIVNLDDWTDPVMIYGNDDTQRNTGRAVWGNNQDEIYFSRYSNAGSRGDCGIEKLLRSTGTVSDVITMSDEYETNIARLIMNDNKILFVSDGVEGEKNCIMDLDTKEIVEFPVRYKDQNIYLWQFNPII